MKNNQQSEQLKDVLIKYDNSKKQINHLQEINRTIINTQIYHIRQEENTINNQKEENLSSDELLSISSELDFNQPYRWLKNEVKQYGRQVTIGNQNLLFCQVCNEYFSDEYAVLQHQQKAQLRSQFAKYSMINLQVNYLYLIINFLTIGDN
ncbi:hypothetical protein pb186bvf_003664 [Paramecium bursaria]